MVILKGCFWVYEQATYIAFIAGTLNRVTEMGNEYVQKNFFTLRDNTFMSGIRQVVFSASSEIPFSP